MPVVIAKKKIGRAQPGEKVKVGSNVVRAVLALGMAELLAHAVQGAPAPSAPKLSKHERRAYRRKDVAAAPAAAVFTDDRTVALARGGARIPIQTGTVTGTLSGAR